MEVLRNSVCTIFRIKFLALIIMRSLANGDFQMHTTLHLRGKTENISWNFRVRFQKFQLKETMCYNHNSNVAESYIV